LAAQVKRHRHCARVNLSDTIAMFEATHGAAPKYAWKGLRQSRFTLMICLLKMMLRGMD
jgi:isocitrate dehydrogenase